MFHDLTGPFWDERRRRLDGGLVGMHPAQSSTLPLPGVEAGVSADEQGEAGWASVADPSVSWSVSEGREGAPSAPCWSWEALPEGGVRDSEGHSRWEDVGEVKGLSIRRQMSIDDLAGYMRSWSGYQAMMRARAAEEHGASVKTQGAAVQPEASDPVEEARKVMLDAVVEETGSAGASSNGGQLSLTFEWPLVAVFARKPSEE